MVKLADIGCRVLTPNNDEGIFVYVLPFDEPENKFNEDCARVLILKEIPHYESFLFEQLRSKDKREYTIEYITKVVSDFFLLEEGKIYLNVRNLEIVRPRQIAMYFSRRLTIIPLSQIGYKIGNKDHATVMNACRTVNNLIDTDKSFREKIEALDRIFKGN